MADSGVKTNGITVWIGTQASNGSSDTYTQVKRCKVTGPIGAEAQVIDATALEDSYREKIKGIPDNGDVEITGNRVFTDAGQNALRAAAEDTSDTPYNVRIQIPGAGAGGSNVRAQFKAIISRFRDGDAQVDGVVGFASTAAITGAISRSTF
jgi:hypothetical protein